MKIQKLMLFSLIASASGGVAALDNSCSYSYKNKEDVKGTDKENAKKPEFTVPDKVNRASIADQMAYAEDIAEQAKLAQKKLDEHVADFIERIDRDWSWDDDRRHAMVAAAKDGKTRLAGINDKVTGLDKGTKELRDIYLELKGSPPAIVKIEYGPVKKTQEQAEIANKALGESAKADSELTLAIANLAGLGKATAAEQQAAVEKLARLSEAATAKKQTWEEEKKTLLKTAEALVAHSKVAEKTASERWRTTLCSVASESDAIITDSNDGTAFIAMATEADTDKTREKRKEIAQFLRFLESHPLLNSELSGSGIQFTSTAGDGKITFKHSLQFGRTTSQQLSFSASAPTSDKNPMKNSVLLDKLDGATTLKLDYTKLNQVNKFFSPVASYTVWGASAQGGYQKFTYFDPGTSFDDPTKPKEVESRNRSYSMAVYGGFATQWNNLLLLRYARQYQREKQDSAVVCPPMPLGATWVACSTGSLGEPKGDKFNIWSGEFRQQIGKIAFSGILTYDKSSKIRAFALPVYLPIFNAGYGVFGSTAPQLSAGLIAGWRSDTGSSIGFFAGMPFSLSKSE